MCEKSGEEITEENIKSEIEKIRAVFEKLSPIEREEKLFFIDKELREEQLKMNKPSEIGSLKDKTIWFLIAIGFGLIVTPMLKNIFVNGLLNSMDYCITSIINSSFLAIKIIYACKFLSLLSLQEYNIFVYAISVALVFLLPAYGAEIFMKKKTKQDEKIQKERSVTINRLILERQIIKRLIK